MINPTKEDIGRAVIYGASFSGARAEEGIITSFNDSYVFVRYRKQFPGQPGQATRREDLIWFNKVESGKIDLRELLGDEGKTE